MDWNSGFQTTWGDTSGSIMGGRANQQVEFQSSIPASQLRAKLLLVFLIRGLQKSLQGEILKYTFTILELLILINPQSPINIDNWHLVLGGLDWLVFLSKIHILDSCKSLCSYGKFSLSFTFKSFAWLYLGMCSIYFQWTIFKLQTQIFI